MAYAALVSLAQLLQQRTYRNQFFCVLLGKKQQLKYLREKVCFLQGFLDNYSHKGGETLQSLEAQIRDAAYQAQDIIECCSSDRIRSDDEHCGVETLERGIRRWMSAVQTVEQRIIRNKHEADLLKALEQIDSIVEKVMNLQISCTVEEMPISHTSAPASSSSAPNSRNKMVGFDTDLIEIKERLCGESSKLQIIPIVGMGGMGKTTLARNIFDDSLVAYHFHTRAWITISQEYHLREILLAFVKSLSVITEDSIKTTIEELTEYVYKNLKGRTYLIIMDDMWSPEAWDDLRRIFPDDNNGSRIVITTRLTHVAEYASSSRIHQMHFLNENQSWNLLREMVFAEQSCPPGLEEIGRIIAKNCGGLPLAIAVVAGILTKLDRTQYLWEYTAENIRSTLRTPNEDFSKVLTSSYDYLPNHLKACFLYMGCFPEDCKIPVSKLVMMWVAEGFLQPVASESLEEVAEVCLEDLGRRNLVLISKKSSNGKFKFCGMHDLLRDLSIRKAQEEKFIRVFRRHSYTFGRNIANERRLTIHSDNHVKRLSLNAYASAIRSVLHFGSEWHVVSFGLQIQTLRVLHALEAHFNCFPVEITELFHLRYLAFTFSSDRCKLLLPPSISKLHNLQTLIIRAFSCSYSTPPLPFEIWKTPQLRHLILGGGNVRIALPPRTCGHFPVLENLQTLSGVLNLKLTSEVVAMIPNLKKLKVFYTDEKLRPNNLVHLHQLETLNLGFAVCIDPFSFGSGLHPSPASYTLPLNLKKSTLSRCRAPSNDVSIIGLLPDLEVLKLRAFHFVEGRWESNEGEFPKLKFLLIEGSNLVRWRAEGTHFSCLQHLIIDNCPELDEIPRAIGDITTLELIEVDPSSESAADSALLIQEEQRSLGNDTLQFRLFQPQFDILSLSGWSLSAWSYNSDAYPLRDEYEGILADGSYGFLDEQDFDSLSAWNF